MTIFLVAHGAWSAGWAWKKMRPLLRAAGHDLFTPTYTGLGERAHLASPAVDLDTHIRDILGVLEMEDLREVVLIGHSYGGMVATGVADRARGRIAQVTPSSPGRASRSTCRGDEKIGCGTRKKLPARGGGSPNPMPPDTSEADAARAAGRRLPQPIRPSSNRCA
jgi:pimeloyl-ACP methyl ester carboxylesterase